MFEPQFWYMVIAPPGQASSNKEGSDKEKRRRESCVGAGASAGEESTAATKAPAASATRRIGRAKAKVTFEKLERVQQAVKLHLRIYRSASVWVCVAGRNCHNIWTLCKPVAATCFVMHLLVGTCQKN